MSNAAFHSIPPELPPLLEAWRSLSEAERTAIESSNWESLRKHQTQKQELQARIDAVLGRTGEPLTLSVPRLRFLPPPAAELIQVIKRLEQENHELLEKKLSIVRSGMAQVNASVLNLRQVQQAYGQNSSGIWESYS